MGPVRTEVMWQSVLDAVETVSTSGTGLVTSPNLIYCGTYCSAKLIDGASVTLTASPHTGWALERWTNCPAPEGDRCTVPMNADRSIEAVFARTP